MGEGFTTVREVIKCEKASPRLGREGERGGEDTKAFLSGPRQDMSRPLSGETEHVGWPGLSGRRRPQEWVANEILSNHFFGSDSSRRKWLR